MSHISRVEVQKTKTRVIEEHLCLKVIGRSGKQQMRTRQCIEQAAYMHRVTMIDERTATVYKSKKKPHGGLAYGIVGYDGISEALWNDVEKTEDDLANKPDKAQTAYSADVALPRELNRDQQFRLLLSLALWIHGETAAPVDFVVHFDRDGNPHGHLLWAQRPYDQKTGKWGKKYHFFNVCRGGNGLTELRAEFARLANEALAKAGHNARVEHESYAKRGVDLIPQKHEGECHRAVAQKTGKKSRRMIKNDLSKRYKVAAEAEAPIPEPAPKQEVQSPTPAVLPRTPEQPKRKMPEIEVEKVFVRPKTDFLPDPEPLPWPGVKKEDAMAIIYGIQKPEVSEEELYQERCYNWLSDGYFSMLTEEIVREAYVYANSHCLDLAELDQAKAAFDDYQRKKERQQRQRQEHRSR